MPTSPASPLLGSPVPPGLLGTYVPAVALGALALLLALALVIAVRRRRAPGRGGSRAAVTAGALAVALLAALSAGAGANAYVGYAPSLTALGELSGLPVAQRASTSAGSGRVLSLLVGDPALGVPPGRSWVYLPPGYDQHPNQRYPVVYLIHGYPGSSQDWIRAGQLPGQLDRLVSTGALSPMIAVAPDMSGGWLHDGECLDAVGGPQLTTYLLRDVVPRVDGALRTRTDRGSRALGGMSSGGYCALDIGLHHLDTFGTLLGFEPYGDPGSGALTHQLGGDLALFRAHSPTAYLPTMRFRHPVAVFLDEGGLAPGAVDRMSRLQSLLAARGQQVQFRVEPGQRHTWREVQVGLPYALAFFAAHLPPVKAADGPAPTASASPPPTHARRPAAAP